MLSDAHQLERRGAIVRILRGGLVRKQADLVRLLKREGHGAIQSSISRDLRDLGVLKASGRYVLPPDEVTRANGDFGTLAQFVRQLRRAGPSITVLRTTIGAAQSVAVAIDKEEWPEVAGTLSGDDTIFIATASARAQDELVRRQRAGPGRARQPPARAFPGLIMSNTAARTGITPIVLAYSGGLDTSFLVPWIAQHQRRPVITVTVDTGGIDREAARALAGRARALGAVEHHQVDARADYFEQVLRFLIMGNVRRGQLYPLCVGAERVMQAQTIARLARKLGYDTVAHGCTAAGNDQVRFEVALRTLAPDLKVLPPVRDEAFKPQDELEYLQQRGLPLPPTGARYSVNRGLWGGTIGGRETLTSAG